MSFNDLFYRIHSMKNTDDCDPKCINGVCSNGNCFCKFLFSGLDCGVGIIHK